jgi:diguanylate cyclase (GGDEF)-like protein
VHRLLERQIVRATRVSGELDLAALLRLVDAAYVEGDQDRYRVDRASLLMSEEMDQLNNELRQLAQHDALTGLPNRLLFKEFASRAFQRAKRGEPLAVLLVDLDRFKRVNDTLGHQIGDTLLCEVTARLRSAVRKVDDVARMGGDEFAIVQVGSEQPQSAELVAQRVIKRLSAPYAIGGYDMAIGVSVGIALAGRGVDDVDSLTRNADIALYRAKHEGGNTCASLNRRWRLANGRAQDPGAAVGP